MSDNSTTEMTPIEVKRGSSEQPSSSLPKSGVGMMGGLEGLDPNRDREAARRLISNNVRESRRVQDIEADSETAEKQYSAEEHAIATSAEQRAGAISEIDEAEESHLNKVQAQMEYEKHYAGTPVVPEGVPTTWSEINQPKKSFWSNLKRLISKLFGTDKKVLNESEKDELARTSEALRAVQPESEWFRQGIEKDVENKQLQDAEPKAK